VLQDTSASHCITCITVRQCARPECSSARAPRLDQFEVGLPVLDLPAVVRAEQEAAVVAVLHGADRRLVRLRRTMRALWTLSEVPCSGCRALSKPEAHAPASFPERFS